MKPLLSLTLSWALVVSSAQAGDDKPVLKTKTQKFSYSVGMQIGTSFKREGLEIDLDLFLQAVRDALEGNEFAFSEQEARAVLNQAQQEYRARREKERREKGDFNKLKGEKYLESNKAKPGVFTLPNGLQYRVIRPGEGPSPGATDQVTVHYRGRTVDGKEFDSSYQRNRPSTFGVNQVIKGWTEALQLMKPGAKWELAIPSELAYGAAGKGEKIGPHSTLLFEVELLSVQKGAPKPTPRKPATSNIVRIPSAAELKKGAQPEVLTKEQVDKLKKDK